MQNPLADDLDHVLAHTVGLWDEMRGERLFITGGTGFFGCWLLESFAWANDNLGLNATAVVLTRNLESFRKKAPHLAHIMPSSFTLEMCAHSNSRLNPILTLSMLQPESSLRLNEENPLLMFDTIVGGNATHSGVCPPLWGKEILVDQFGRCLRKAAF